MSDLTLQPDRPPSANAGPDELADLMQAYHQVTERLHASHQRLEQEVVRLHQELASTNAQLQRSKRLSALGEMAAGISHEIRNPLAAIQLYAQMVVEDTAPAPGSDAADEAQPNRRIDMAHDNARKIADAVRGLSAIVHDVLTFARHGEPRCGWIDAGAALLKAVDEARPVLDAAGVNVRLDAPSEARVWADADQLHRVLLNLVRNAAQAMGEDGADGDAELRLVAERAEADTRITIRDSGPGIDDDAIDRLFNPFFTTRSTGTGLGLPIVHRLLDAHGGSISVRNDGGAVFQISLPHPPEESTRAESCPADEAQSNPQVASTTNQYSGAAA